MTFTIPKGYRFAGIHCEVKPNTTKKDLALIVSDLPAVAAGVYTTNLVCGAPVQFDRSRTPDKGFRCLTVNSGVANACTGERGLKNAELMADLAAQAIGAQSGQGLVMSTGVIGIHLPMDRIEKGIQMAAAELGADQASFENAAQAIMTTDTVMKTVSKSLTLSDGTVITLAGMAKGAGMIGPNMGTMLAAVVCDALLNPEDAARLLKDAANDSFNCISVDGHTSTSDTLILFTNGAAKAEPLTGDDLTAFGKLLKEFCIELAKKIPDDGEGISHLITIDVNGCKDRESAMKIAKTIANDALVKTAIAGADPNWGRITSASGRAGVPFDPMKVSLKVNGFLLYENGTPLEFDKKLVSDNIRNNKNTSFEIFFAEGNEHLRFWTTDLTKEYVHINSEYTT